MIDKSELPDDTAKQIQILANDICSQVEEQVTFLLTVALNKEINKKITQQSQDLSDEIALVQKRFDEKQKIQSSELIRLHQVLVDKQNAEAANKQHFQAELFQNKVNYIEQIDNLENNIIKLNQEKKEHNQEDVDIELRNKLHNFERELASKKVEINDLRHQVALLTSQEESLADQESAIENHVDASTKEKIEVLTAQSVYDKQQFIVEKQANNEKVDQLQKSYDNELMKTMDEMEKIEKRYAVALKNISTLENNNKILNDKVKSEQCYINLYQQESIQLKEQIKSGKIEQESLLKSLDNNRKKHEEENNKVREAIKELRDENYQLVLENSEQKAQFTNQTSELEQKVTEYRLKFEYAQKQLNR